MIAEVLTNKPVKITAASLGAMLLIFATHSICAFVAPNPAAVASRQRMFICSETGKPYTHELKQGETLPIVSPFTKSNTGYPAELCYWTKDGGTLEKPVPVLLRQYLGERGPTFCPDCGRLVTGHNPVPGSGMMPPPSREEYARSHRRGDPQDDATADAQR